MMCTVKPFYKHYFARIDKWDDKIANNFLELGYAVSIVVPLDKVKVLSTYIPVYRKRPRTLAC